MNALARGIQLLIGIGRVRASQEKSMVGTLQVQLNAMETVDGLVNSSHYGFHSRPHAGCDAVVAFVGGDRSKGVVISTGDQRYRVQLSDGEVVVHDDLGQSVHLKRTGIVVNGGGLPITLTNTPKVRMETPVLQVTGDVLDHCDDAAGQTMHASRQTYDAHTHTDSKGGTTSAPRPQEPE